MGFGWSYLVVSHSADQLPAIWEGSDGGTFSSEKEMLRELGATGWELVWIREPSGQLHYYFKRSRS